MRSSIAPRFLPVLKTTSIQLHLSSQSFACRIESSELTYVIFLAKADIAMSNAIRLFICLICAIASHQLYVLYKREINVKTFVLSKRPAVQTTINISSLDSSVKDHRLLVPTNIFRKPPELPQSSDSQAPRMQKLSCLQFSSGRHKTPLKLESLCPNQSTVIRYTTTTLHGGFFSTLVFTRASLEADKSMHVTCSTELERSNLIATPGKRREFKSKLLLSRTRFDESCANPLGSLLVVSATDFWNWWWFLVELQNAYISFQVVDHIHGPIKLLFLEDDSREKVDRYGRGAMKPLPLKELYPLIFSPGLPATHFSGDIGAAVGCYKSIVFLNNGENASPFLKNTQHKWSSCYSPVIAGLGGIIRSAVKTLETRPQALTVCWMSRDEVLRPEFTDWQKRRTISGQGRLVRELNDQAKADGVQVTELAFYGNYSTTPITVQLTQVAQCSLLVGIHGAGLYAAIGMHKPAILELTLAQIPNRNALNLMNHIGGCYQGMQVVQKQADGTLESTLIWSLIHSALLKCKLLY